MKWFKRVALTVAVAIPSIPVFLHGAATVTASKDYVDRKTKVESATNLTYGVVGYTIGTNTNSVFASTNYVDSKVGEAEPGDYSNVSNAAMRAYSDLVEFASTGSVYRISDGTNMIDAAGNVYLLEDAISQNWSVTNSGIPSGVSIEWTGPFWQTEDYGGLYETIPAWYAYNDFTSPKLLGTDPDALTLQTIWGFEDYNITTVFSREIIGVDTNYVGRLALTNDLDNFRLKSDLAVYSPETTPWRCKELYVSGEYESLTNAQKWSIQFAISYGYAWPSIYYDGVLIEEINDPRLVEDFSEMTSYIASTSEDCVLYFERHIAGKDTGNRIATTNDIPPAVTVVAPSTNATFGTAADAKSTGTALYTGFTEWECVPATYNGKTLHVERYNEEWNLYADDQFLDPPEGAPYDATSLTFSVYGVTASRHLVTPTKTSQLMNDGDGTNQFATVNLIDASNETFSNAVLSVGFGIDTNTVAAINALVESGDDLPIGGATTVGAILLAIAAAIAVLKRRVDNKASVDDLPYALVEPGKWEFSDGIDRTITGPTEETDGWYYKIGIDYLSQSFSTQAGALAALSLDFDNGEEIAFTATRASLPGNLCDRANNLIDATSGNVTLTLPALEHAGKARDFLVRLTVSADAVVTFSAPTGETITWDDAGSPTATYEAGTHLLRFTEVAQGVFHFTDLGDGGSIDPAVLNGKLEATSAAPAFDPTKTYSVGEHVTYEGVLYECSTAVTTAGAWTGSTNWTATNMTTPDATLDLMADGRLRLVSADGVVIWMQGYDMASASAVALSCDRVNYYAFASGTYSATFTMPAAPVGKVGDFVLDIDNSANASDSATATLTGAGTAFDIYTANGENITTDVLTFAGGEQCELYFTMTAFGTAAKPAWKVVKQVVEKAVFGS